MRKNDSRSIVAYIIYSSLVFVNAFFVMGRVMSFVKFLLLPLGRFVSLFVLVSVIRIRPDDLKTVWGECVDHIEPGILISPKISQ